MHVLSPFYALEFSLFLQSQTWFRTVDTVSTSRLLVQIVGDRLTPVHKQTVCSINSTADGIGPDIAMSKSFIAAMGSSEFPAEFSVNQGTATYSWNPEPVLIGYSGISTEPIPTSFSDPRIIDWDKDGYLAASVSVQFNAFGTLLFFIAQQSDLKMSGALVGKDIVGTVDIESFQQRVLSSKPSLWIYPRVIPRQHQGSFRMVPINDATCNQVERALDALISVPAVSKEQKQD